MRPYLRTALIILWLFLAACSEPPYPRVSLAEVGAPVVEDNPGQLRKLPLRLAVAAVISPQATLEAYDPLLEYLAQSLDRPVQLFQRNTYAEINELEVMNLRAGWIFLIDDQAGPSVRLVVQSGLSAAFAAEEAERELGACVCARVLRQG